MMRTARPRSASTASGSSFARLTRPGSPILPHVLALLCRDCREGRAHDRCGGPLVSQATYQVLLAGQHDRPTRRGVR